MNYEQLSLCERGRRLVGERISKKERSSTIDFLKDKVTNGDDSESTTNAACFLLAAKVLGSVDALNVVEKIYKKFGQAGIQSLSDKLKYTYRIKLQGKGGIFFSLFPWERIMHA